MNRYVRTLTSLDQEVLANFMLALIRLSLCSEDELYIWLSEEPQISG